MKGTAPQILKLGTRWMWLVTSRCGQFTPGKERRYPLNGVGHRAGLDISEIAAWGTWRNRDLQFEITFSISKLVLQWRVLLTVNPADCRIVHYVPQYNIGGWGERWKCKEGITEYVFCSVCCVTLLHFVNHYITFLGLNNTKYSPFRDIITEFDFTSGEEEMPLQVGADC